MDAIGEERYTTAGCLFHYDSRSKVHRRRIYAGKTRGQQAPAKGRHFLN
jgi:hypothetical protein